MVLSNPINIMSLLELKEIINVNSENRVEGTDSSFKYELNLKPNDYDYVVILQASIPKSFYLVQSPYNTFVLDEGTTTTITLPEGNYKRKSLQNVLTTLLNDNSPNGWTYAISYSNSNEQDTGKLTFTVSGNGGVQPSFIFGTNLYKVLGFDKNSTNTFVANSLTSANVFSLLGESTLYLRSDLATNREDNILQEIFCSDVAPYDSIVYKCIDKEACAKSLNGNSHATAKFYLTDEDGTPISLNGQNMLFSIMFFKKESWSDYVKRAIKAIFQL